MIQQNLSHESVLRDEVLNELLTNEIVSVFDGTLGLGGHAEAILSRYPNVATYIATDLDSQHLDFATKRLESFGKRFSPHHGSFSLASELIEDVARPLAFLFDLGLCSNQIDDPEKGFAFAADGPLTMAFDDSRKGAAAEILNTSSERELTRIFREYGEEPSAYKIARTIVSVREEIPFTTTTQLREAVEKSVHITVRKKSLVRVFQALRIAVNDELTTLQITLTSAVAKMQASDRVGVISYHSLEDRIVKKIFATAAQPQTEETPFSLHTEVVPAGFRLLTKRPIVPTTEEIARNPRARSAKFRILEKI
jgi:16S rRNA (cytosine1402-N4)-methyltransferase